MEDQLASLTPATATMFGSIKETDLTAMDDASYDLSFSNPSDSSSSSSYLNSSAETYLPSFYPLNLSHQRYFEDEACADVKPFGTITSPLDYPAASTDMFLDDQTPTATCNSSKLTCDSVYQDYKYELALAEIRQVLKCVCDSHCLPLAQTWSPCAQQPKNACHQQSGVCISAIRCASYVFDPSVLGFYEACCEAHLVQGQGIAGKALGSNQPCFATDITGFCKAEYPLSEHARVFGLGGAVAVRLRSTHTGSVDFVLEMFLPRDCRNEEEQKQMLSSISCVIQRVSRSLHVISDELLAEEESVSLITGESSSWISHMIEAQKRGESFTVSMGSQSHKEEPQEFKVIEQSDYHNRKPIQSNLKPRGRKVKRSAAIKTSDEKRRVKSEKNISLPLLQQYFPGSLKDAAKNIGVCPTTLKRICREHGIMRWPSRKIKKVGHSLKKLQLIIDSVEGAEGTIQLGSFYTNFPELSNPITPNSGSSSLCCSNENTLKTQKPEIIKSEREEGDFRVKVVYGEKKIRFCTSQDWGYGDFQREIMRQFCIDDPNIMTLKYLDDDCEWVLLTCDADLEECMDINMASKNCTIKLLIHQSFHPESRSSFTAGDGL